MQLSKSLQAKTKCWKKFAFTRIHFPIYIVWIVWHTWLTQLKRNYFSKNSIKAFKKSFPDKLLRLEIKFSDCCYFTMEWKNIFVSIRMYDSILNSLRYNSFEAADFSIFKWIIGFVSYAYGSILAMFVSKFVGIE